MRRTGEEVGCTWGYGSETALRLKQRNWLSLWQILEPEGYWLVFYCLQLNSTYYMEEFCGAMDIVIKHIPWLRIIVWGALDRTEVQVRCIPCLIMNLDHFMILKWYVAPRSHWQSCRLLCQPRRHAAEKPGWNSGWNSRKYVGLNSWLKVSKNLTWMAAFSTLVNTCRVYIWVCVWGGGEGGEWR